MEVSGGTVGPVTRACASRTHDWGLRWPGSLTCSRVAHTRLIVPGKGWTVCSPDARSLRLPGHRPSGDNEETRVCSVTRAVEPSPATLRENSKKWIMGGAQSTKRAGKNDTFGETLV